MPLPAEQIVDLRRADVNEIADRIGKSRQARVFITDAVMIDVSATGIRRAVSGKTARLRDMVPPAVAEYIRKYRLYEDSNEH
jgi:nicotinic acid mononucleotide adenylyltransferase